VSVAIPRTKATGLPGGDGVTHFTAAGVEVEAAIFIQIRHGEPMLLGLMPLPILNANALAAEAVGLTDDAGPHHPLPHEVSRMAILESLAKVLRAKSVELLEITPAEERVETRRWLKKLSAWARP
jgi:hypothetical protein